MYTFNLNYFIQKYEDVKYNYTILNDFDLYN